MLDAFAPTQTGPDHKTIFLALLAAASAHVVVLAWFGFAEPAGPHRRPILSLTLLPNKPAQLPPEPTRQIQIEPVTTVPPTPVSEPSILSGKQQSPALPDETPSLLERSLETIRNEDFYTRPAFRSFSTLDFPAKNAEPKYQRASVIQQLVTAPGRLEFRDSQGFYTIKTTDSRGNVICMQERGFAGDGNPPMWYRIPAATCSHIK